jgi:hypothetical protein
VKNEALALRLPRPNGSTRLLIPWTFRCVIREVALFWRAAGGSYPWGLHREVIYPLLARQTYRSFVCNVSYLCRARWGWETSREPPGREGPDAFRPLEIGPKQSFGYVICQFLRIATTGCKRQKPPESQTVIKRRQVWRLE